MKVLVTGTAGFIGMHTAHRLLDRGHEVTGVDCLTDYYDVSLKRARLATISSRAGYRHAHADLGDPEAVSALFDTGRFDRVIHLAAQPGVRYSLVNPRSYIDRNITAFVHVLEACRHHGIAHLVYASSSSVYGGNTQLPFRENHPVDHPVSLYAATKRANELMAHTYSHLFGLPTTGLRFFTVYGPWGRPDMAYWLFTEAMLAGRPIRLFNEGRMKRDFTFVDDIVAGVIAALDNPPAAPAHRVYNIGNSHPEELLDMVAMLEELLGVKAVRELMPMQPGDVPATFADVSAMQRDFGWRPTTDLRTGLGRFVAWWRGHFG